MVSNTFFLIKEATTESFYLFKVTSAIDAKKPQQLPQYYFKTNISNLIFIRMLFLHTNKSKNKDPDFIYIYKYI